MILKYELVQIYVHVTIQTNSHKDINSVLAKIAGKFVFLFRYTRVHKHGILTHMCHIYSNRIFWKT